MMKTGIECFAGANTAEGFFSGFDGIYSSAKRTFFIKGAPGTGKSSLMKRIAQRQKALGHEVSVFHCSSDPDSYDGVIDETISAAIMDATAPHSYDPPFPGATGSVLSLGDNLDEQALARDIDQLRRLDGLLKAEFQAASAYLAAAAQVRRAYGGQAPDAETEAFAKSALPEEKHSERMGRINTYFLSAHTHKGVLSYSSIFPDEISLSVAAEKEADAFDYIKAAAKRACLSGLDAVHFLDPTDPRRVAHVYLPEQRLFITSELREKARAVYEVKGSGRQSEAEREAVSLMFSLAHKAMRRAKELHDELETYYIPRMDFSKMVECEARVIQAFDKLK